MSTRRQFLKQVCGTALLATTSPTIFANSSDPKETKRIFYSAASDHESNHYAVAFDQDANLLFSTALPDRAHSIIVKPDNSEIVVIARRPRHFMLILDALTGELKEQIQNKFPLYGHGVFSSRGKLLFVTENDYVNQQGIIGIHDVNNGYKKVDQFQSGGIGPHELRLLSDQKTLVVANGGILTHPDTGRNKLNLNTMSPALTYLDTQTGKVLDDYRLDKKYHQLSIRHLDINNKNEVCFAMQYQGPRNHSHPLIGFHRGESTLQLVNTSIKTLKRMKNYCGSVAVDTSGEQFAVSSPRGNLITYWHRSGKYLGEHRISDGCGIAKTSDTGQYYLTNGFGEVFQSHMKEGLGRIKQLKQYRWDNHLTVNHILATADEPKFLS